MVKQAGKQNPGNFEVKPRKSKESLILRNKNPRTVQKKNYFSDSTQHSPIPASIPTTLPLSSTNHSHLSEFQNQSPSPSIISQRDRMKFVNHLMYLVKEIKTLPFNFTVFKSIQYLDIYFKNLQKFTPNLMEAAVLASIELASEVFHLQNLNLPAIISKVHDYKFCLNQVLEIKSEMQQLNRDQKQISLYETLWLELKSIESQGVRFSQEILVKCHHYLRLSLLKPHQHPHIAPACIYLSVQQPTLPQSIKDSICNYIFNKYQKGLLQLTIKFMGEIREQFGGEQHIFLMTSQLRGCKVFD